MKTGFIGIGQMGRPMAGHLLEAGYEVVVNDVNKESARPLLEKGAGWADSPAQVAESCRLVITMLPTPQSVEYVVYGENGLMAGWRKDDIYVDMSTNSPTLVRRIAADAAKLGVHVLDAPVSGGVRGAVECTLAVMAGGEPEILKKVEPVLLTMGQKVFPVGDVGGGNVVKLVNNMMSLAINSIAAEGFVLGVKAGIDPLVLLDIISVSTGNNWSMRQFPNTTFKGNFEPGFKISLAHKDIGLALGLGEELGVPLPVGEAVRRDLEDSIAAGLADKGVDAVILPLEEASGVTVRVLEE